MDTQSFVDRKNRTFDFMDELRRRKEREEEFQSVQNRPEFKLRKLEDTKKEGIDRCLNTIFGKLYVNSIPTNSLLPQSTCINGSIQRLQNPSELCDQMGCFINGRSDGKGPTYYVNEAIKRNKSQALQRLMEGCEKIVNEQYADKTKNPDLITPDDYTFKLTGESETKLNDLMNSLQMDDLADVIKQNVKTTAINEIEAAKKEKEERDQLETELSQNNDITTESAIDEYLASHNLNRPTQVYQPSLFEGIMIGKFNSLPYMENVSDGPVYNVDLMTEGVVEKVRRVFMSKEDRELLDDFKTYEGAYKRMLGMYESEVKSNDHNAVIANCKKGLSSSRVSPKCTFSLPDIQTMEKTLNTIANEHKAVLRNPKDNKGGTKAFSTPKAKYTIPDAIKQYSASVNYLNSYFKDSNKMNEQIEKYQKIEAGAKGHCENTKEIKRVKDAVSGLLVVETTRVMMHIQFIQGVVQCSKTIAKEASRMTAKESAFEEAVKEYTMLSCIKALRLEDFSLPTVRQMATDYAAM